MESQLNCGFEWPDMTTWTQLTDVGNSVVEIDLDTIAYMYLNGPGTEITFKTGKTLTVRESPENIATPKKPRELAA
jgi:hypothetical protein